MNSDEPVPRELKILDTPSLLRLEERAYGLRSNQRLDPAWVEAHAAREGTHYLWPALWKSLPHRPGIPGQLRCELLITLRTGDRVMSLLDVMTDDFAALPKVTSRDEGMRVSRLLDSAPSVRDWLLGRGVPGRS
ncbi:hypothetical protein AB0K02_15395 [Streptomyces sp. NPDC049597]|uniref:hypothetical protein n=1 Tax=Streptomyces sp. NPDC049597 TaxID=3155276 RepID=UPI00343F8C1B